MMKKNVRHIWQKYSYEIGCAINSARANNGNKIALVSIHRSLNAYLKRKKKDRVQISIRSSTETSKFFFFEMSPLIVPQAFPCRTEVSLIFLSV